jgi:hypothetical protein
MQEQNDIRRHRARRTLAEVKRKLEEALRLSRILERERPTLEPHKPSH